MKKCTLSQIAEDLDLSNHTVVDWLNFIRDVCAQYFLDHPIEIGGLGIAVEIDESKFGRRKYIEVDMWKGTGFLAVLREAPAMHFW